MALTIHPIAENDPRLPTPNIASNTSSELKVQELTTDARILAAKWPLFEARQPIWVSCSGFDKNGDPVNKDVRSGEPNDSPDGLSVLAPVEWLKTLKDGSELTIACAVNLDGSANEAEAVKFPLRTYSIKAYPLILSEDFDDKPAQRIRAGESIDLPSMTITYDFTTGIDGYAGIRTHDDSLGTPAVPGMLAHHAVAPSSWDDDQQITFRFKSAYSRVRFANTYRYQDVDYRFCDDFGQVGFIRYTHTSGSVPQHGWIDFSAPSGRKITSIEFRTRGGTYLDYFTFWV
ncbi:Ig-like domain-containing protein [Pseudomonas sp. IT-P2]